MRWVFALAHPHFEGGRALADTNCHLELAMGISSNSNGSSISGSGSNGNGNSNGISGTEGWCTGCTGDCMMRPLTQGVQQGIQGVCRGHAGGTQFHLLGWVHYMQYTAGMQGVCSAIY